MPGERRLTDRYLVQKILTHFVLTTFAIFFLSVTFCSGQMNVADVSGVVSDPAGDAIVGAMITATNTATGLKLSAATRRGGDYLLSNLTPGSWDISATAQGFKQAIQQNVQLHAGDRINVKFSMVLGERTETLIVEGFPGLLQTESAQLKDVIDNQQVTDLPVKDREFLELALLGSGVVNPPGGTRGDSLQQTGKLINILGQRTGHNLFLVDGVSVTDEYYNNVVLNPPPDAIREFNIAKTDYDAEFGGKSGGVINVITQSGANSLHGSLYEFLRNSVFDARNFFAAPNQATPFQENQFGGAVGGPIIKNKTFFFLNYDGQRIRDSIAQLFSVPTAAQRSGIFTTPVVNPTGGTPFPNNTINVPLDPAAVALLAKLPLPNLPGTANNLLAVDKQTNDNNQYDARIDHQFSSNDTAYVRASALNANEFDPFGSSVLNEALLPGFGRNLTTHSANVSAGETHSVSANMQNEFRFGFLRVSGGQGDPNAGAPFASQYGLQGTTANPSDMGYPQVSLSNAFTTIGSAAGFSSRVDRNYEIFDNVSIQRGAHAIKFGGYFFHLNFNPAFPNDARGVYTYSGAYSGNPLADFLLGDPSQAQVGIGEGAENAHTSWAHFYVEDGWRVTQRLKLDFGLRYEFNENLYARTDQTSDIDISAPGGPALVVAGNPAALPPAAAALAALSPIPVVSAASVGWNNSLLTPKSLRLSPRLGLAWQLPHFENTVFRAGFGIYTNQASYSILQNLAENAPFFLVKTVANPAKPAYTTENILNFSPTGAIGANGVNHNFAIEYNEVWNAALQKTFGGNTSLEISYVGSRTVHADSATAVNVPAVFGGPRPFPELAAFSAIRWDGWATFHGLTVKATHRFNHGLSFDSTYTWSKSMDDASDAGTTNAEYNLPEDPYAMNLEKGLSSFDHRRRFTANAVYDLPFGRNKTGWLDAAIGGWRLAEVFTAQSGAPFTINLSSAAGQNVSPTGLVSGNNLERPNLIGNPDSGPQTPAEWFNTAAFAIPAMGTYGTAGRNVVTGPDLIDLDLSLQKEATLHERLRLQLRLDAYNSLNRANFNLPGRIFGAANFGVIGSAADPRELQWAAKLLF
ncbi:MAG TPA: carboxypeptidase regulatory-like domain-containing protein [Bryobacteraceae bacterium]|nr:carboxypeptidase regulatory-like domain-containing protein [Bryobacteraceae bacterium]